MKNALVFSLLSGVVALVSCGGPSAEEKAATESARLDSIKVAEQAKLDSMATKAAADKAAAYQAGKAEGEQAAPAEETVEPVAAVPEKSKPVNIIQGKKQEAEKAQGENIIQNKKNNAAAANNSDENIIQQKKNSKGN